MRLHFEGSNEVLPVARGELSHRSLFLIGNDPSRWTRDVRSYREVAYQELYSGIDLILEATSEGLKYEFRVHPGGDPSRIVLVFEGAQGISITSAGELVVGTAVGDVRDAAPVAFQSSERVPCGFERRSEHSVGFHCQDWDPSSLLVIDPLVYSTFVGGTGNDEIRASAIDGMGNVYATGLTESTDFPISAGPFDDTASINTDAFVIKIRPDPSGSTPDPSDLLYSTYLGGTGYDEGTGIAVDGQGIVYVAGFTTSWNFPISPGAFDNLLGGGDAFVVKLNPDSGGPTPDPGDLIYSTYVGGTGTDGGEAIAVDDAGVVYVAGGTYASNFPVSSGAFDGTIGGAGDAVFFKLDPDPSGTAPDPSDLIYSTYLGGSDFAENAVSVSIDGEGFAHLTGYTASTDFPVSSGAFSGSLNGVHDAFVVKLKPDPTGTTPDASDLIYSTYLGGSGYEDGHAIIADGQGAAYIVGGTQSANFPVSSGAFDGTPGGLGDAFLVKLKLDPAGPTPDPGDLIYSTYLGGSDWEPVGGWLGVGQSSSRIALDDEGRVYLASGTWSTDFPVSSCALDNTLGGPMDAFLIVINPDPAGITPDLSDLVYSTYIGGGGMDSSLGVSVDQYRDVYVTGFTESADFPMSAGSFDNSIGGPSDAYVVKIDFLPDLAGIVWNDVDHDGILDLNENGIWGVTVSLYDQSMSIVGIMTTSYGGTYAFPNIAPGTYHVVETNLYGWVSTTPDDVVVSLSCSGASANFGDFSPDGGQGPSYAVSTGVAGGGRADIRVGQSAELCYQVTNSGTPASQLRFLTFTAAIRDSNVATFASPPSAQYSVLSRTGALLGAGTTSGAIAWEPHAGFVRSGSVFFQTSTWTLPEQLFLEGGGLVLLCFDVVGVAPGSTSVQLFARSSEDNPGLPNGIPLPLIADKRNVWQDNSTGLWYPGHNSYDPWDSDIANGHSWSQWSWIRIPTQNQYAKDSWTVNVSP